MLWLVLAPAPPHNYSDDLRRLSRARPTARMVREAERWMRTGGARRTSPVQQSRRARLGDRSAQTSRRRGFREWRQTTPTQYLRKVRLDAADRIGQLPFRVPTTVTSVALANGFFHLPGFSAYYRTAFDEGSCADGFGEARLGSDRGSPPRRVRTGASWLQLVASAAGNSEWIDHPQLVATSG